MEIDIEKIGGYIKTGFKIVLWVSVLMAFYFTDWGWATASAALLAVLELEEINGKLD
jgi:hypothetical protein